MKMAWSKQLKDSNGVYTNYGIYKEIEQDLIDGLKEFKDNNKRVISYKTFRTVIGLYFKYVMDELLNGGAFPLYNRFGELRIAKRKIDRYVPKVNNFTIENGKVKNEKREPIEVFRNNDWFRKVWQSDFF